MAEVLNYNKTITVSEIFKNREGMPRIHVHLSHILYIYIISNYYTSATQFAIM